MANNRKGVSAEERLERSCRLKMDIIRGLIRGQESAEDRALCANWLKFLSRSAKDEARARDCLLEQMVRQLRELGHLSLPFTTQADCRTELRLLLDEEGRQRLRRLNPPVVVAPQSSRTGLRSRSRSRRPSPFVWRQRVQHLNTLEEQYRREEQELWRNEFSVSSQPREGAENKEIGIQVDMPVLSPREERDYLDRTRKQQEIIKRRERERLERQQRDKEYGRQNEMLAEQRHSDRQRREEVRQLREQRLLEQKLKVKERREHERKLLAKKREAQQSPRQERAPRQKRDEVKEELVANREMTRENIELPREAKKLERVPEARKQVRCQTCDRKLPPDTSCDRCETREHQALLRAENVKQKVMAYEQLKQYHRERALAERERLKQERSEREKKERRREIEKAQRRLPTEGQEIDALDVERWKRETFEMYERVRLKKARLDQEKEEQRRKIEEAERWCRKELENVRKLREEQEAKEKRDATKRKLPEEFVKKRKMEEGSKRKAGGERVEETKRKLPEEFVKKRKMEEGSKRKAGGERVEGGKEEEPEDKENKAREQSKQRLKEDRQRKVQEQCGKERDVEERDTDDLDEEDSFLREKRLLQKWDELREKYSKPAGEQSPIEESKWRKKEITAKEEFLRETTEHTEQIRTQIREKLESRKKESLRKENEEKLLDKPIEKELIKERKAKESATKQEQRKKITDHLDRRQYEKPQLEGMPRANEVKGQSCRDQKTKNVRNDRKTLDQTEKRNVEEQPPGDRKSEPADDKTGLLRARKKFLTKLGQMSLEKKPRQGSQPDHDNLDDVRNRLKKIQEEKDQLTKQNRDRCQELQKKRLAMEEAGLERAQHRDLGSHSWKMAHANWLHADIIKEKCLQELEIIEAAMQKRHHEGEDAESATLLEPHKSPGKSVLTPKVQPLQAKASQKKPKAPKKPSKRGVRLKDSEEGSEEEVTNPSSNELVPLHSMIGKTCLHKETKPPCPGVQDRRYTGGCGVSYCTQTGRKRFPQICQHGVRSRKENLLQRRTFCQLLSGSRPTEFNPKVLTAENRILKRKLSAGKRIALNKHIQRTLMLRASRFVDLMLKDKALARPDTKPRLIFQALIDSLLRGMQNVSRKLQETIILLDGELEAYLGDLCNSSFDKQQQEHKQAVPDWRGLPRDEHLVSDLFNEFRDLDPKLNKTLQRIDHLYKMWKDQRLKLQQDFN